MKEWGNGKSWRVLGAGNGRQRGRDGCASSAVWHSSSEWQKAVPCASAGFGPWAVLGAHRAMVWCPLSIPKGGGTGWVGAPCVVWVHQRLSLPLGKCCIAPCCAPGHHLGVGITCRHCCSCGHCCTRRAGARGEANPAWGCIVHPDPWAGEELGQQAVERAGCAPLPAPPLMPGGG